MGEVFSFGAEDRGLLVDGLSRRERPSWLRIVLHGDARALGVELAMRVWQGRVIEVTPSQLGVARVLLRMAFARSGRIEVRPDVGAEPDLRTAAPIRLALADAEKAARAVDALLAPIGGPAATVVTRATPVMRAAAQLGRTALEVANQLIDQPRLVGDVLGRAPDDLSAARALDQLRDLGVLEVVEAAAVSPSPGPSAPPGAASARPTERSRPPTLRSRAPARPRLLEVPEPADDDEPELERALADAPRVRPRSSHAEVAQGSEAPTVPPPVAREGATASVALVDALPPRAARSEEGDGPRRAEPAVSAPPRRAEPAPPRAAESLRPVETARAPIPRRASELDTEAALGRSSTATALWLMAAVIALLFLWWMLGRGPAPAPEPVAARDPTPMPVHTPPPAPVKARTSTPTPAYSLSHPPPLAGPEADRRLREAERLIQAGRYDEADAILAPLRVSRAEDPLVWLLTGTLEIERDRLGDAAAAIDRAIRIDPKSYRGYILRGSIQQFQGSARSAVQSYRTALAISPAHPMSAELREVTDRLDSGAER